MKEKNSTFFTACFNGDLNTVKALYEEHESLYYSRFLRFFSLFFPQIDPHWKDDSILLNAITYHHYDIAEYLLSKQSFLKSLTKNNQLGFCASLVMKDGNLELTKLILKHKEYISSHGSITTGFNSVCSEGHLELLEYLTTDQILNLIEYDAKKVDVLNYPILYQGFISACNKGQLEVVKYLTSSPHLKGKIDFNQFNRSFKITNTEILYHLIMELNIKEIDPVIKHFKISSELKSDMDNYFRLKNIQNLHNEINLELKPNSNNNQCIKI